MPNTNYITLSRQQALQKKLEVIANNTANANTTGFKAFNLFLISQEQIQPTKESITLPLDYSTFRDLSTGPAIATNNPYDAAILGKGFFAVSRNGEDHYTRDGHFTRNENGELVTHTGDLVQGAGGGNIQIPNDVIDFSIMDNGSIRTENGIIGKLRIVDFDDPQDMEAMGDNLFKSEQLPIELQNPNVKGSMIEGSNVEPAFEITEMIAAHREFEINQRIMTATDEQTTSFIQSILA